MRLTASVSGAHYFVSEESKVNLKIYKQVCNTYERRSNEEITFRHKSGSEDVSKCLIKWWKCKQIWSDYNVFRWSIICELPNLKQIVINFWHLKTALKDSYFMSSRHMNRIRMERLKWIQLIQLYLALNICR